MRIRKCKLKACRQEFTPVTKWQEFHQPKCRDTWHYEQKALALRQYRRWRKQIHPPAHPSRIPEVSSSQAQEAVDIICKEGRSDLIAAILAYAASGNDSDDAVLARVTKLLRPVKENS